MRGPLANLKTIVVLFTGGTAVCVVVLAFFIPARDHEGPPALTMIAVGWAAIALSARVVVLRQVERSGRQRIAAGDYGATHASKQARVVEQYGDTGRLFLLYQTRSLIGAALPDGAALFGGVATLMDGNPIGACVGGALCAWILLTMPSSLRWEQWKQAQEQLLREELGSRELGEAEP